MYAGSCASRQARKQAAANATTTAADLMVAPGMLGPENCLQWVKQPQGVARWLAAPRRGSHSDDIIISDARLKANETNLSFHSISGLFRMKKKVMGQHSIPGGHQVVLMPSLCTSKRRPSPSARGSCRGKYREPPRRAWVLCPSCKASSNSIPEGPKWMPVPAALSSLQEATCVWALLHWRLHGK